MRWSPKRGAPSRSHSTSTTTLRREGLAREVVHAIQNARKQAGLDVTDRITLKLDGDETLLDAARSHQEYVAGETLATTVEYDVGLGQPAEIEGRKLQIYVERAQAGPAG